MTQITITMDEQLKEEAEVLFQKLGFSFSEAINMLLTRAVEDEAVPVYVTDYDELRLLQSFAEKQAGKIITKTMEELRAMEE